ncbi:MAG: ABC transporter ATP-binding protein [Armatimonadota bacterium]
MSVPTTSVDNQNPNQHSKDTLLPSSKMKVPDPPVTRRTHREIALRLLAYLAPYKLKLAGGLLCAIVAGLVPAGVASMLAKFIKVTVSASQGSGQVPPALAWVCGGVVLLYALLWLMSYGQNVLLAEVAQRVGMKIRSDVYRHLQQMPLAYFHTRRTGALMSTLTSDVTRLQNAAMMIKDIVANPITVVVYLVLLLLTSWKLTLFALLAVPFMAGAIQLLSRRIRSLSSDTQGRMADVASVMEETISNVRVVKAFTAEDYEIRRFEKVNEQALEVSMRGVRRSARLKPTIDFIGAMGIALALWIGGSAVARGEMEFGDLIAFILLVVQLANSVGAVGNLRVAWEEMMGAADRIFGDVLDVVPEIRNAPDAKILPPVSGRVEFRSVSFNYDRGVPALTDVNLTLEPGSVVALVGPTGAGKSTLADMVPRFFDPQSGTVLVDGNDIRTVTLESLRSQIGIVPQETVLFSGTLRDNIAYGRRDASDEEIFAAARAANADSFIQTFPMKYETVIGERGAMLSGGEKQRIAIARALLANPRILILDEATSALDAATEALVQEALDTLMKGRTTLIIAHRLSTIVNADMIVVLRKGGRIAEQGTHTQLLSQGGIYAALYETQQRTAELTATTES